MSIEFGSAEWVSTLASTLNNSPDYASAAATWEGDLYFVCTAGDGIPADIHMYFDLQKGACLSHALASDSSDFTPEFVLSAPLSVWQPIIETGANPIRAIMMRQIALSGPMTKIMRHPKAALALVACASQIDTAWPTPT